MGFDEVQFSFGQFRFPGILLQYDQVGAHLCTGINKEILRQADGGHKVGMIHQPFPYRTVPW